MATIDDKVLEYFAIAKGWVDEFESPDGNIKNPVSKVDFAVDLITKEAKLFVATKEAKVAHDEKLEEVLDDPNIFTKK